MDGEARVVSGLGGLQCLRATTLEDLSFIVDPINKRLIVEDALLMRDENDDVC